jgi:maltooligosyltrehalose trehalohydrolase
MLGERTSTLVSYEMLKLLAAAVVISPYLPMFFMGEEWGEPHPFLYFVSHSNEDLVHAVRKGRKEEFAAFHTKGEAPDPFSEETFQQSKLQWQLINEKGHATLLNFYKNIISLRKSHPVLSKPDRRNIEVAHEKGKQLIVLKRWNNERTIIAVMNFSKEHNNYHIQDAADKWNKILDSSDNTWGGKGSLSPASLLNRNEYKIDVSPESIVVYESVRESD